VHNFKIITVTYFWTSQAKLHGTTTIHRMCHGQSICQDTQYFIWI